MHIYIHFNSQPLRSRCGRHKLAMRRVAKRSQSRTTNNTHHSSGRTHDDGVRPRACKLRSRACFCTHTIQGLKTRTQTHTDAHTHCRVWEGGEGTGRHDAHLSRDRHRRRCEEPYCARLRRAFAHSRICTDRPTQRARVCACARARLARSGSSNVSGSARWQ